MTDNDKSERHSPGAVRARIGKMNDEELLEALSAPMSVNNNYDLEVMAEALHRILIHVASIERNRKRPDKED